jgi:hypothetical protein
MEFESHEQFFDYAGDHFIQPRSRGECYFPVTVEELYRHFKARMLYELSEELGKKKPSE